MNPHFLVNQCYDKLPEEMKSKPWEVTEHGRKMLQTEDELNAYIAAYGEMHIIKCRAALQNFPFQDLNLYSYEIFDWGCGQGLATITLLDMLRARKVLSQLRCIYLIEPSIHALNRATTWVKQFTGPGVKVVAVNKYIPGNEYETMPEVQCSSHTSINLYSNILDIRTISLSWLAHKTAMLALTNYQICIGPKFTQNSRLADYCGYFNPKEYFSNISILPYAYTTRTHHAFGCETKCFVHNREDNLITDYQECADQEINTDPYDCSTNFLQGIEDRNVIDFYNKLRKASGTTYDVFYSPNINCDVADFILTSKSKGIILINICKSTDQLEEAFKNIESIKNNLFSIYMKSIKIDSIVYPSVYNCIKTALYFPYHTKNEILKAIDNLNSKEENNQEETSPTNTPHKNQYAYLHLFTKDSNMEAELEKISCNGFKYDYYEELIHLISSNWHTYTEGDSNFKLSPKQKEIVSSKSKRLRIKGVAGCGKTQVVANRAVERHLKTGDRVLILTYNISLIQYIRMRINQVPADFLPNMFEIINYHQFFKSKAKQYYIKISSIQEFDSTNFFEVKKDIIKKYKTIIIDEVQDFKPAWLQSITKYFLDKDGSISLFGDGEQNIYDRELEAETKMPTLRGCGFPGGPWQTMNERISMRIINPNIASLSSRFAHEFLSNNFPIHIQDGLLFDDYKINYWFVSKDTRADQLVGYIRWILQEYHIETKDATILGQSIHMLRDVDDIYRKVTGLKSMISFETLNQYEEVLQKSNKKYFQKNLEEIRRAAKTHFTTDCEEVKLSTIHSFKGWESNTIILLLQSEVQTKESTDGYEILERENFPALIYTAMTRAKCNLFILNIGNQDFHTFFYENTK